MKTIPKFSNYAITKDGRIWSKCRGRWLKPGINSCGYLTVVLWQYGKPYTRGVHRLVLETFVGVRPSNMQCRHLNGIKIDNRLKNLCWGTHSENSQDSIRHGTFQIPNVRGEKVGTSKLTETDVRMIIYMYRTGEFFQREIAKIYQVTQTAISRIILKKSWKHIWN